MPSIKKPEPLQIAQELFTSGLTVRAFCEFFAINPTAIGEVPGIQIGALASQRIVEMRDHVQFRNWIVAHAKNVANSPVTAIRMLSAQVAAAVFAFDHWHSMAVIGDDEIPF